MKRLYDILGKNKFNALFVAVMMIIINLCLFTSAIAATKKNIGIILVTGFEPFGGDKTNGSWEAVRHLQGKQLEYKKTIVVAQLPVIWEEAGRTLRKLIQTYHPVAVIAFGQAGIEPVRLELVAHNRRQPILDNHGALPATTVISKGAPASIKSRLNVQAIAAQLRLAGIPVMESSNAGDYLCNEAFFILMNDPGAKWAQAIPRGFIHVPPLNATVATSDGDHVLFDLKTLEHTADIIVETVAKSLQVHNR